jgi:hypothetical protein
VKVKSRKFALIVGSFLVAIMASSALIGFSDLLVYYAEAFTPHYLTYAAAPSRVYLASATTSNIIADQTYLLADGQEVPKGSELLQLKVILRNDYTSDNPPPSKGTPVSPVDGTAYICLSITLYSKNGAATANILSPSDFSVSSPDEIGLVLASGQTNSVNINLASNPSDISRFEVNLVSVGDSILS